MAFDGTILFIVDKKKRAFLIFYLPVIATVQSARLLYLSCLENAKFYRSVMNKNLSSVTLNQLAMKAREKEDCNLEFHQGSRILHVT